EHPALRNPTGPARNRWDTKAAFEQFTLHAGVRPDLGEPLATVVAGEDDDRVVGKAVHVERLQDAADIAVEALHHRNVGLLRAAVAVKDIANPFRLGLVVGAFPGPMWRGEMQAEQERLF